MMNYVIFMTVLFLIHCVYREAHDFLSKVSFYDSFKEKKEKTKLLTERNRLTGKPVKGVFVNCVLLAVTYWIEILSLIASVVCLFLVPSWFLPIAVIPFCFLLLKIIFKPGGWFRRIDAGVSCFAYSLASLVLLTAI